MPQKKNSQSHVQKKLTPIKNWYHTHTQQFYIVTGITLALTALLLTWQLPIHKERTMYQNAEKQITQFVDEAAQLAPSTKEVRKYCSYSSAKYSKGYLGCTITGTIRYKHMPEEILYSLVEQIEKTKGQSIRWKSARDNTWNPRGQDIVEIRNTVYGYKTLTCNILYAYQTDVNNKSTLILGEKSLEMNTSCSGSALREHYPV